jgi:hypothetical protein
LKIVLVSCVLFFNALQAKKDLSLPVCRENPQDETGIGAPTKHGDNRPDIGRETMSSSLPHKGGQYASFCEMGDVADEGKRKAIRFRINYRVTNEVFGKAGDATE